MVAGRSMGHVPILVRRCSNLLLLLLVMVVVVSIAHATMCLGERQGGTAKWGGWVNGLMDG
jgi:hypothetical protein